MITGEKWKLWNYIVFSKSRDSSVGIATSYGLDDRIFGVRFPAGPSSSPCSDWLRGPSGLLSNGYQGSFTGVKMSGVWNWPLTFI
jgi:hypothetical protein